MINLSKYTTEELQKDLRETEEDIATCQTAIDMGVFVYGDDLSVPHRLEVNKDIAIIIRAELERREQA